MLVNTIYATYTIFILLSLCLCLCSHFFSLNKIKLFSFIDFLIHPLMHLYVILYILQFGFGSEHSTNLLLIEITEKYKSALDQNKVGCGVFADWQKAVDTVNHEIL